MGVHGGNYGPFLVVQLKKYQYEDPADFDFYFNQEKITALSGEISC